MDIDEKQLWDILHNCGFSEVEIRTIRDCIEFAKKPDSQKLREIKKTSMKAALMDFKMIGLVKHYALAEDLAEKLAEYICATFGTPLPDALAEQNKRLRDLVKKMIDIIEHNEEVGEYPTWYPKAKQETEGESNE